MTRHTGLVVLLGLLVIFGLGVMWVFDLRLSGGDLYPPYSSLRADPLGTRALHDALQRLPEIEVERTLKPLQKLPDGPPRTIVLAGISRYDWLRLTEPEAAALNQAVRAGSRLVLTFHPEVASEYNDVQRRIERDREMEREEEKRSKEEKAKKSMSDFLPKPTDWKAGWGIEVFATDTKTPRLAGRVADAPERLPASVVWKSDLHFAGATKAGWRILYQRGSVPVVVERDIGRGTVVLATDSYFLSNEALLKDRSVPLLEWMLGAHRRVSFCEAHLGVVEDPGIAALGRRYGLGPAFFTLLVAAALFIWQRSVLFVPPPPASAEVALSYSQTAGLEALLRRAIRPGNLIAACTAEWFKTARPGDSQRARAALAAAGPRPPGQLYNLLVQALKRRL